MNDKTYVSTSVLNQIATEIANEINEISNIYSSNIAPALNLSKTAFTVAGLNTDDVSTVFYNLFRQLNTKLDGLRSVLVNKVIPGYNETANLFATQFGTEFATQFGNFLQQMKVNNDEQ